MNRKIVLVGLFVAILLGIETGANGQCWGDGFPYAPAYWGYGYQGTYIDESIPYFALHPPVYYSHKVARTYGYSPFAYPPGVLTPNAETSFSSPQKPSSSQQQPEPLRITNPFVEQLGSEDVTDGRKPANRQPQIIYPAALVKKSNSRVKAE